MALQPGDIEKALNNYRETRKLMSPLVDFVIDKMLHHIDFETSRVFEDDEAIAIQLQSVSRNLVPVLFLFWFENNRFSLFVDDKEVVDEFLSDESELQRTLVSLETILSHEIHRVRFMRRGKVRKVIYTYWAVMEDGAIEKQEDQRVLGISMPWSKNERVEHLFDAWIMKL